VRLPAEIDWEFLAGRFSSVCRARPGEPETVFQHEVPFRSLVTDALAPAGGRGADRRAAAGEPSVAHRSGAIETKDLEWVVVETTRSGERLAKTGTGASSTVYVLPLNGSSRLATQTVTTVAALRKIEGDIRGVAPVAQMAARQQRSAAIELFNLWEMELPRIPGKSKPAEATGPAALHVNAVEVAIRMPALNPPVPPALDLGVDLLV
jgi:hypothetical protein